MNRLEFSKSINCIDIEECIKKFFDETMLLYNITADLDDIKISGAILDDGVSFSLVFKNNKERSKLHNIINNSIIPIYDRKYMINSSEDKAKCLLIYLNDI